VVLENINTKNSENVLTAESESILTFFTLNLKMTKLNSQTKITKSINKKNGYLNFRAQDIRIIN